MTWRPRFKNHLRRLLSLAAVVLLAASITQCRMVTDRLVRAEAEDFGANGCVRACIRAANEAKEDEKDRHEDIVKECRGDKDIDDKDDLKRNGPYDRNKPDDKRDDRDKKDQGDKEDKGEKKEKACLKAEEARHKAALKAIDQQRRDCMNGCHHQGGGSGR